jgi:uncharacterized protein (TIGR02145 family)
MFQEKNHITLLLITFLFIACNNSSTNANDEVSENTDSTSQNKQNTSAIDTTDYKYLSKDLLKQGKYGTFTDSRDGEIYHTIKIGDYVWMAENLRFQDTINFYQLANDKIKLYPENDKEIGTFYPFNAVISPKSIYVDHTWDILDGTRLQGICPENWHLPSFDEWNNLIESVPDYKDLQSKLSSWKKATNKSGFSAIRNTIDFKISIWSDIKEGAFFWILNSSSKNMCAAITDSSTTTESGSQYTLLPVRCVQDYEIAPPVLTKPEIEVPTDYLNQDLLKENKYGRLVDVRDGKVYRTIKIGEQNWMAQNLEYIKPELEYDSLEIDSLLNLKYGLVYRWFDAMYIGYWYSDNLAGKPYKPWKGLCPDGWHIPFKEEFQTLINTINTYTDSLNAFIATGFDKYPNATNTSGFSILPVGNNIRYWTAEDSEQNNGVGAGIGNVKYRYAYYSDYSSINDTYKDLKYPVRCIQD